MASVALSRGRLRRMRFPPIRPRWLILAGLVLLAIVGWFLWNAYTASRNQRPNYQASPVARGTLRNTVAATGPIANPASVPLNFKSNGQLDTVSVAIGDRVQAGQVVARLRTADLENALAQAQASYQNAAAAERLAREGPTPEAVAQAQATLDAARVSLDAATKDLETTQKSAAAQIASAQADLDGAATTLANAQKALDSTSAESETTLAADQQAIDNAQVALDNAQKSYDAAVTQANAANASNLQEVNNSIEAVASAQAALAATQQVNSRSSDANQVTTQNAQASLSDAQREFDAQKKTAEQQVTVSQRQRDATGRTFAPREVAATTPAPAVAPRRPHATRPRPR